ncbi:hypothetical protein C0J52_22739 [Blattella germanica]|nr:hypothetical protein C0J52_22739 [Blattella germanica]
MRKKLEIIHVSKMEQMMGHVQTDRGQFIPKSDDNDMKIAAALKDQFEPNGIATPEASCICIITVEPVPEADTLPVDAPTSSKDIVPDNTSARTNRKSPLDIEAINAVKIEDWAKACEYVLKEQFYREKERMLDDIMNAFKINLEDSDEQDNEDNNENDEDSEDTEELAIVLILYTVPSECNSISVDSTGRGFAYLSDKFPRLSASKIK